MKVKFNYKLLAAQILYTFQFGDKIKTKLEQIGITANQFNNLKKGVNVELETVLSCRLYLANFDWNTCDKKAPEGIRSQNGQPGIYMNPFDITAYTETAPPPAAKKPKTKKPAK